MVSSESPAETASTEIWINVGFETLDNNSLGRQSLVKSEYKWNITYAIAKRTWFDNIPLKYRSNQMKVLNYQKRKICGTFPKLIA